MGFCPLKWCYVTNVKKKLYFYSHSLATLLIHFGFFLLRPPLFCLFVCLLEEKKISSSLNHRFYYVQTHLLIFAFLHNTALRIVFFRLDQNNCNYCRRAVNLMTIESNIEQIFINSLLFVWRRLTRRN